MTDSEIWNTFGSDSSSSDDDDGDDDIISNTHYNDETSNTNSIPGRGSHSQVRDDNNSNKDIIPSSLVAATDAALLQLTAQFLRVSNSSGVPLQDRVVGIGIDLDIITDEWKKRKYYEIVAERVHSRGIKIMDPVHRNNAASSLCDAAIFLRNENSIGKNEDLSYIKRSLLPNGSLWMIIAIDEDMDGNGKEIILAMENNDSHTAIDNRVQTILAREFPTSIWSTVPSSTIIPRSTKPTFRVVHLQKQSCAINTWSCPWMNKAQHTPNNHRLISAYNETEEYFPLMSGDSTTTEDYLQYERRVTNAVTIVPSAKERSHCHHCDSTTSEKEQQEFVTILTEEHVQRASEILQNHGLVIIKGLLSPSHTVPWGEAVLSDFQLAVSRLKCHATRPVDLLNPQRTSSLSDSGDMILFEPLSYKEMAMREDLRVDLRSGPEMEKLRMVENELAVRSMEVTKSLSTSPPPPRELGNNNGPTMIHADVQGTVDSWRFHPSILAIIKQVFNPRKEVLSKGNFGRWNFGGSGPNGTPQPFRLGQIGSVISCPGSADQAIHADTPHLFEHEDCLPCHYLNVFTPGYHVVDDPNDDCVEHEFCDGIWTGNSTLGGTAFVYGSHKLSVSAQLLAEEEDGTGIHNGDASSVTASMRKKMRWLRTLRPSLEAGDVLMFDCRTIHFGLANTSRGDQLGWNSNAGRRPMLYANVTQSWFHDPKNWDDRERIFE